MCTPDFYKQVSGIGGGKKIASAGMGGRLDQASRSAAATAGGGTYDSNAPNRTILSGMPRNTDVAAIRKTSMLGV
jgi:hypothetical protein